MNADAVLKERTVAGLVERGFDAHDASRLADWLVATGTINGDTAAAAAAAVMDNATREAERLTDAVFAEMERPEPNDIVAEFAGQVARESFTLMRGILDDNRGAFGGLVGELLDAMSGDDADDIEALLCDPARVLRGALERGCDAPVAAQWPRVWEEFEGAAARGASRGLVVVVWAPRHGRGPAPIAEVPAAELATMPPFARALIAASAVVVAHHRHGQPVQVGLV